MQEMAYRIEFGIQIKRYLEHFELEVVDIVDILTTNSTYVYRLMRGEVTISFSKMVTLADIFGIPYYDFANPSFPFPAFEALPKGTQTLILGRKKKGKINKNLKVGMSKAFEILAAEGKLDQPFTAKKVFDWMDPSITEGKKSTEVTNIIKRKDYIVQLPHKISRENIFVHKNNAQFFLEMSFQEIMLYVLSEKL